MKTLEEAYSDVADALDALKKDPRRMHQTDGIVNAAGKMVQIVNAQMYYSVLLNQEPNIPAMGKMSGKPLQIPNLKRLK